MPRKNRRNRPNPEILTVDIETLSHDGRGITHVNGKIVFVAGALPGETIQFQYLRQRGSFDEARAVNVLEPAPQRETPLCKHFGVCGGCSSQHISAHLQVQYKHQAFQELLRQQNGVAPAQWLPALVGPRWGYRRKARLGVKFVAKKNRVFIGFREHQGRLITDSVQCQVLAPAIGNHLEAFAAIIYSLSIRDKIPQLEIAVADNAAAVIIRHLQPFSAEDLVLLRSFAEQYQLRIYLQPGGYDSLALFYPSAAEALFYELPRYLLKMEFQPLQFIQINAAVNQKMIDCALALLDCQPHERILDLFCGIGNFSLPMARSGIKVIGIEGDSTAVEQARHNAKLNGLTTCEFYSADLFQSSFTQDWAQGRFDKILLDPPRSGAQQVIANIHQWQPSRIVYVSCDMATLARDSLALLEQGYKLAKAGIMDMFPHTQHAEAIALFEKA